MGYDEADLEGRQYILEEGEYPHVSDWGGSEDGLLSLRPIVTVRQRPGGLTSQSIYQELSQSNTLSDTE